MNDLVKCLVWDLDNTVWSGVLSEGDECHLRPGLQQILRDADARGILLSIASANDEDRAMAHLQNLGIADKFICPRICWGNKVESIRHISEDLGVALDAIGFIDDEPFQREQVRTILPKVRTYDALETATLLARPEFDQTNLTKESRNRRQMYIQSRRRSTAQHSEGISQREFLRSCRTELTLRLAEIEDIPRILELLRRTHQLNATGIIFDPEEVTGFMRSPAHRIYVASMKDRFVDYGRIGVVICHCLLNHWTIMSCLLSCRVLGRGIGAMFLNWVEAQAIQSGVDRIRAHYLKQDRNRPMYILYTMSGFEIADQTSDGTLLFHKACGPAFTAPDWLVVKEGSAPCELSESS